MKILVTGASGGLALALVPALKKQGHAVVSTDLLVGAENDFVVDFLNVADAAQVFKTVESVRPDWVMHLAAETDVDLCEKDPDHAFKVNTLGTENVAMACQKTGAGMVYISSGAVFNGNKRDAYTEFDAPDPVSVYGRSKYEGEKAVQSWLDRYFIFRAGWMVGGGKKDKKFVAKITQLLQTQNELKAVNDKFGTPTFVWDMAEHIAKLFQIPRYGTYHLVNAGGITTRYEIALKIVEILDRKDVKVHPVSSAVFPLPAPRAVSEAMANYRLDLLGLNTMPPWQESLRKYLLNSEKTQ